jgi:hypothetical protein
VTATDRHVDGAAAGTWQTTSLNSQSDAITASTPGEEVSTAFSAGALHKRKARVNDPDVTPCTS